MCYSLVQAIFFDLYETLITEWENNQKKASYSVEVLGIDEDVYKKEWVLRRERRMNGTFTNHQSVLRDILQSCGKPVDENAIEEVHKLRVACKLVPFQKIDDTILQLLQKLKEKQIKIGLISNCTEEEVIGFHQSTLVPFFDDVIFSYKVKDAKPNRGIYELACKRLSVTPEEAGFVGDGGSNELQGASEIGMKSYQETWFLPLHISMKNNTFPKLETPSQLLDLDQKNMEDDCNVIRLPDPTNHPDWINPHSLEWYKQLGEQYGVYHYPWKSLIEAPNGETIFDEEVLQLVKNKKVLDVGCGHGHFTKKCSMHAKEIIGFDVTDQFISAGNLHKKRNVSFVVGNTKNGLLFDTNSFDCAYIRKGPTSAYTRLADIVKNGGRVVGLHPGDSSGQELIQWFPNLFKQGKVTIKDVLEERLAKSNFTEASIEEINTIEYIESPIDVIKMRCFGQKNTIFLQLSNEHFEEISRIFDDNATSKGLPVTFSRYIVRAIV